MRVLVCLGMLLGQLRAEGVAATVAGTTRVNGAPVRGFGGDGGSARKALLALANLQNGCGDPSRFEQISHIAFDPATGSLFIADSANHRVRRIDAQGAISTAVGSGQSPTPCATPNNAIGDGGQATAARLYHPAGIAMHPNGSLIVADQQQNRVRQVSPNGVVTTIAGNGLHAFYAPQIPGPSSGLDWPTAVAVSPDGLVYFTELHSGRVARIDADGRLSTVVGTGIPGFNGETGTANAIRLQNPTGLGFDAAGNLYIADQGNNRVRKVTPGGALTTIAGSAQLNRPADVKADALGNVYISDMNNHRVLRVDPSGAVETVAGTGIPIRGADGVPATSSALSSPTGLAVNAAGDVFVVDWGNALIRMIVFSGRPVIASDGVLNSANFEAGPIAPGSLFSIFGMNFGGGTSVRVNGQTAPINFVGPNQVNAQMPYGVSGEVSVAVGASPLEFVTVTPASVAPFVYAGTRRAIAVNQDGSLNGPDSPESRGRVITVYATGIGAVTPEIGTGEAAPPDRLHTASAPYSAVIGGVNAPVLFLGLAPGFLGLAQANIQIPETGGSVLTLRVGESASAPGDGVDPMRWLALLLAAQAFAQHEHHHGAAGAEPDSMAAMRPSAEGGWFQSGTSQAPRETPLWMLHSSASGWQFMFSGVIFGAHTNQSGPRGRDKFFAPNWFMPMATRRLVGGLFTVRSMFTLEPLTITGKRYPLIFQTGELANGIPIISGQHPHDFFMELGVSYQRPVAKHVTLNFFAGPRGEPALGPPAFPHRASNSENPIAVISHHYQDSTHISSSVVTAGVTAGPVTLEASGFHGREPDEKRWGMEQGAIDSFAARVTVTPTKRWAGQFSMGRINNREETHPDRDTFRMTSSLGYSRAFAGGHWVSTLVWGRNHDLSFTQQPNAALLLNADKTNRRYHIVTVPTRIRGYIYNSFLAESTLRFGRKHWIWGRAENVDRDSYLLYEEAPFVRLTEEQRYTRVQVYTAGYEHELPSPSAWMSAGLGGQVMIYGVPANLRPVYGDRPVGVQVFLRLRLRSAE